MTIPSPAAASSGRRGGGRRRAATGRMRVFTVIAGPLVLIGLVAGVIWPLLVSDVQMQMTSFGPYPISELDAGGLISMDGWYALLAAVGGLLTGSVLATVFMRHGRLLVLGLLVGAVLAAVGMYVVGSFVGNGELVLIWEPAVEAGTSLVAPVQLHAYGALLVWPIAVLSPVLPLALFAWPIEELEPEVWELETARGTRATEYRLDSAGGSEASAVR